MGRCDTQIKISRCTTHHKLYCKRPTKNSVSCTWKTCMCVYIWRSKGTCSSIAFFSMVLAKGVLVGRMVTRTLFINSTSHHNGYCFSTWYAAIRSCAEIRMFVCICDQQKRRARVRAPCSERAAYLWHIMRKRTRDKQQPARRVASFLFLRLSLSSLFLSWRANLWPQYNIAFRWRTGPLWDANNDNIAACINNSVYTPRPTPRHCINHDLRFPPTPLPLLEIAPFFYPPVAFFSSTINRRGFSVDFWEINFDFASRN